MGYGRGVFPEPVREVAFGSITASYTTVGSILSDYTRIACFNNSTNKDLYISFDGVNNHLRIAANGFKLFDITANEVSPDEGWFINKRTQFYVKQTADGAPTSGNFWIEILAGEPIV